MKRPNLAIAVLLLAIVAAGIYGQMTVGPILEAQSGHPCIGNPNLPECEGVVGTSVPCTPVQWAPVPPSEQCPGGRVGP